MKQRRVERWLGYQRKHRPAQKRRIVDLFGGGCQDCGYSKTIAALEFHHRDPLTKEFGLGRFNGSWVRLIAEAAKCDLVCTNCHRLRHATGNIQRLDGVGSKKKERAIALMAGGCVGCGGVVALALFEFHHWDARENEFGISRDGMTRPWEEIVLELAKCVMLSPPRSKTSSRRRTSSST